MSKQNNIEEKYSTIISIEGEDGTIRFKLNSLNDFNGSTLADVAAYSEKMRNMYQSTKQKNDTVNSLMNGDLNYSSHSIITPYFPDSTTFYINDLSQNDKPKLIGETAYPKNPMEKFLDSLKS